jgi:putative nucleotidyltransferase with HDIG domain
MEELIKFAEKIGDKDLREKTIALLKDPKLSNDSLKYKPLKIKDSPGGYPGFEHHMAKGGLLVHTVKVSELSLKIAESVEEYGPINKDLILAGALLHDIMRIYDFKKEGKDYLISSKYLEHEQLIGCELYARGFPEELISIVLNHIKPETFSLELGLSKSALIAGPTNKKKGLGMSLEGMIVHYADTIDAYSEFYFRELFRHMLEEAAAEGIEQ